MCGVAAQTWGISGRQHPNFPTAGMTHVKGTMSEMPSQLINTNRDALHYLILIMPLKPFRDWNTIIGNTGSI